MKAMPAGAMNWKRSFGQSRLRYVFITMRLRLSAVFGDRQRLGTHGSVEITQTSRLFGNDRARKSPARLPAHKHSQLPVLHPPRKSSAVFPSTAWAKLSFPP